MTSLLARVTTNILRLTGMGTPLPQVCATSKAIITKPPISTPALVPTINPVRLMSCCKQKCIRNPPPRCCPEELAKTPCHEARSKCKDTSDPNCSPFKSMWENPECCRDPCPDVFPRFDDLYYRISDKSCRTYQQTWNECPELMIRPKPLCCFEKICMPPFEKRPPRCCPKTACPPKDDAKCKRIGDYRCPKIEMPCCGPARNPPKCRKVRKPSCCVKVCCPYPSYSECCRDRPPKRHPIECKCLRLLNTCEAFDYVRSRPWLRERPRY